MGDTIDLQQLLQACFQLAELSGQIIRQVMKSGDLDVVDKGGMCCACSPIAPRASVCLL